MDAERRVSTWKVSLSWPRSSVKTKGRLVGDVTLSAEDKPPEPTEYRVMQANGQVMDLEPNGEDEEPDHHVLEGHSALKFLLAGGVAGAGTL